MKYNFDFLPERRHSESVKWRLYDEDVLPMWVADMDFISPEPVIQALAERVAQGVFGYPQAPSELCQVVMETLDRQYQWKITPEELIYLPGVVIGYNLACHAVSRPGKGVLMQTPVYPPFFSVQKNCGLVQQEVELTRSETGEYSIDFDAFERTFTEQTSVFLLCNPHNPVGRVFRRDELEKMAEICLRKGVFIISDEIHCDLIYSGYTHIPIARLAPEVSQNTITLMAPSKTFNIAGLDCSFAIIQNPELRHRFNQARRGLVHGSNLMGLIAALAAYRDGWEWLEQLMVYLQANRDFVFEYVNHELPGICTAKPEGTYLAWLDCRKAGIPGKPGNFFLEKGRVALNEGDAFGKGGEGFVRLNFGCPKATLIEGLERMKSALLKTTELP